MKSGCDGIVFLWSIPYFPGKPPDTTRKIRLFKPSSLDATAPWQDLAKISNANAAAPIVDILLHVIFRMAVALLDLAFERLALASNRGKVVIRPDLPML
ncbi:MAG: hypothetical protein ACXU9C_27825, partial [Xanthobacteraceae bacterium]